MRSIPDPRLSSGCVIKGLTAILALLSFALTAEAFHISPPQVLGTRTPMPDEGYLGYRADPRTGTFGDEWAGWIDVRHPSLIGPPNTAFGYGRSDRFVQVQTSALTDNGGTVANTTDRRTDFEFANKAYLYQGGLSVLETRHQPIVSPAVDAAFSFDFPLSFNVEEINIMRNLNVNRHAPLIDTYYAGSLGTGNLAETFHPSFAPVPPPPNPAAALPDGIFMANFNSLTLANGRVIQGPLPDVFAHEMFHFLGDGNAVHTPLMGDPSHSNDPRNLISPGNIHFSPGQQAGALAAGTPPWNIPKGTGVIGPPLATSPGGAPQIGGIDQLTSGQIRQIFIDPQVADYFPVAQRGRNAAAGDRVDWDFVVDQRRTAIDHDGNPNTGALDFGLEAVSDGVDNFQGQDALFWSTNAPTRPSAHVPAAMNNLGHNHEGLAVFKDTLDFGGAFFRTVDVFSLDVQFDEADGSGGLQFTSGSVLDYDLFFLGLNDEIVAGVLDTIFINNWANAQNADDYLGRWISPIPAAGVLIRAHAFGDRGHDGNTQIDAIIASPLVVRAVPEPSALALIAVGGFAWLAHRRHTRKSGRKNV